MRPLLCLAATLLLCSCASAPQMQSGYADPPDATGSSRGIDPRMQHAQFYVDDADGLPAWAKVAPSSNR